MLSFEQITVFSTTAEVAEFVLGYSGTLADDRGATNWSASVFLSPGRLTSDNTDTAFRAQRAGANADYVYTRATISRQTRLPGDFGLSRRGTFQLSSENLLGTEQLVLGGSQSVRGFGENTALTKVRPAPWLGLRR